MIIEKLTGAQKRVIKDVCQLEIRALNSLLNEGLSKDVHLLLSQHEGATEDEFFDILHNQRLRFGNVLKDPSLLFKLKDEDLSIFRHILFNLEEIEDKPDNCITVKYPHAIKNIWRKLFTVEQYGLQGSMNLNLNLN